MSVVDKPVVDRKFVLAQVAASTTYFDLLGLPAPCTLYPVRSTAFRSRAAHAAGKDALGRATWSGSTDDIHRAFRYISSPPPCCPPSPSLPGRARSSATQTKRQTRRFALPLIASAHPHCGAPNTPKLASFPHIYCPPPRCRCYGKFQVIRDAKEYLCQEPERLEYCKLVVEAIDALKPAVAMGVDSKSDNDMIAKQLAERRLADELRQQERQQFEGSVLEQMHMRRKAAEVKAKARKAACSSSSSGASSSDGEQEGDSVMRKAAAGRKKPRMLSSGARTKGCARQATSSAS